MGVGEAAALQRHGVAGEALHRDVVTARSDPAGGVGLHLADPGAAAVLVGVLRDIVLELVDRNVEDVLARTTDRVGVEPLRLTRLGASEHAQLQQPRVGDELGFEDAVFQRASVGLITELAGAPLRVLQDLRELLCRLLALAGVVVQLPSTTAQQGSENQHPRMIPIRRSSHRGSGRRPYQ